MTIKSLTITEDAYDVLNRLKLTNESFSDVIVRIGKGNSSLLNKYFGILKEKDADEWIKEIKKQRTKVSQEFVLKQKKLRGIE